MASNRTKSLQKECERLSDLQRKATGAKYLEIDKKWSRVAVILNKSRLRDFVNSHASNKACSGLFEGCVVLPAKSEEIEKVLPAVSR